MSPTSTPSIPQPKATKEQPPAPEPHSASAPSPFNPTDTFPQRHIGPNDEEIREMLGTLGYSTLEQLADATVPESIRLRRPLNLPGTSHLRGEHETLRSLHTVFDENHVFRSCIGTGYHDCITPPVIQRNILENPGWYTQYTPYQAEISQGRLEALLNFQTMISDLTGLPLAGASLLDEATAAAEAMGMCYSVSSGGWSTDRAFFAASDCHPQTLAVLRTRARFLGLDLLVGDVARLDLSAKRYCGVLAQYPTTDGRVECYESLAKKVHEAGALLVVAADPLALVLLKPPGEFGADIAVGSAQRFGVPMGFGGPHAAYIATKSEYARRMPGRIIGVSRDAEGRMALRMAIQTREQHIRREKATSNICTAQALLAIMAGMYAVYHGPHGMRAIAQRARALMQTLRAGLLAQGHQIGEDLVFDTLRVRPKGRSAADVMRAARDGRINLRDFGDGSVGITLDETADRALLADLLAAFGGGREDLDALAKKARLDIPAAFARKSPILTHPVFNTHHSETELLRYIFRLQSRDLSLAHSMIPLGSCTMKLNATSEMLPVTWATVGRMHPYAPADQTRGYQRLCADLEKWLAEITGFAAVSLQPNSGAQGEYAGLLVIRAYHEQRGQKNRTTCLIPDSAHGTNPASAITAGMHVVPVACDDRGNIDLEDLRAKAREHATDLGAIMITYPSTHGVFEESIRDVCRIVHEHGGQVYMDGANMNAQVGLCRPGDIGADVCHLNLHKTFCIPHGGGGPGMGPIGVAKHLAPFLPGDPVGESSKAKVQSSDHGGSVGAVSAARWGSASILPISWVYIALMGAEGLKKATEVAILNANYMAKRLTGHYTTLFTGRSGRIAHEFILDLRPFEASAGIKAEDVAKRLMDYGFHAPTMSFPVPGTLMIEPTESESKAELDHFCEAMIGIREEIRAIETGQADRADNVLKNSPHTSGALTADEWKHRYSRREGGFPQRAHWLKDFKFWPPVARIDNPFGDRNLVCTCPPMDAYRN